MDQLKGIMDQLKDIMDQLKGIMDQLNGIMDQLKGIMDHLKGIMDQFKGIMDQKKQNFLSKFFIKIIFIIPCFVSQTIRMFSPGPGVKFFNRIHRKQTLKLNLNNQYS